MKPIVAAPFLLLLGVFACQTPLAAQQSSAPSRASKLLNDLWGGDVNMRRTAEAVWQDYQSRYTPDPQVRWAYVLNRIDYDKYREARSAIELLTEPGSTNWDQRYAKIWLEMVVGEIDAALLDMQQLKTDFDATGNVNDATRFRLFTRLGRLMGYVEGPGNQEATPQTLQDTLAILTHGLNDVDFGNFEDQRQQAVQKYADLLNEKNETAARKNLERQQKHQTRTTQLVTHNQDMAERQKVIVSELGQLRTEANNEINQLRDVARPIEAELQGIDSRLRDSDIQISRIVSDIRSLEARAYYERDPCRRDNLFRRARDLQNDLYAEESYRAGVQSEYDAVISQLSLVTDQIATLQSQVANEARALEQESRDMINQQRRNDRELKKLKNPLVRKTGYERAMTARTGHLPTYDPFPTDELRRVALSRLP